MRLDGRAFVHSDEANNALDDVRPVAERLVAVRARMRELEHAQGELVIAIGGNGGGYAATDLNEAQTGARRLGGCRARVRRQSSRSSASS